MKNKIKHKKSQKNNKIICPICEKQGTKSKVYSKGAMTTLMGYPSYYDEDGNYHHHNRNLITEQFNCEFGHTFVRKSHNGCPSYPENCDFAPKWEIKSTTFN